MVLRFLWDTRVSYVARVASPEGKEGGGVEGEESGSGPPSTVLFLCPLQYSLCPPLFFSLF